MDEKEGASSIQAHSDDIKPTECNPCKYEGICKDAITFCLECNENLCHACEQFHKKFSSTRKHETVLFIHFSWLGPELLVCCLAHRGPTGVFLLLRS